MKCCVIFHCNDCCRCRCHSFSVHLFLFYLYLCQHFLLHQLALAARIGIGRTSNLLSVARYYLFTYACLRLCPVCKNTKELRTYLTKPYQRGRVKAPRLSFKLELKRGNGQHVSTSSQRQRGKMRKTQVCEPFQFQFSVSETQRQR